MHFSLSSDSHMIWRAVAWAGVALLMSSLLPGPAAAAGKGDPLNLNLRSRAPKPDGPGRAGITEKKVAWDPSRTALIVCDMWDDHWCKSAARRVVELAEPLNAVVKEARSRGVFII